MSSKFQPVLIIGGSGVVGSQAARIIRRLHPELPIAIGGRDLGKAEAVAREVGGAIGVSVDLGRADLGLGDDSKARYRSVDGVELDAVAYSPFDVMALSARTNAGNIRLDLAYSESASRRRGEPFSTEILIDIAGRGKDGQPLSQRHEIVHPEGQAQLTALGIALAVERMLGLAGGKAPAPGLYLPEVLIEPAYYVERMKEFGAAFAERPRTAEAA
ncbi:hypothetical protein [Ensifer sp. MJa1]|uniref:hypothetical protein n=1 Tax=Ensifer sp. MJa1 TaxID=2919888 RepID=UPI003008F938